MFSYVVRLTDAERGRLEQMISTGRHAAATLTRARILLKADRSERGPGWNDEQIVDALDTSGSTVHRVRQQFVEDGLEAVLYRKPPTGRQYRKLDGAQEAQLIALACSEAPEGHARWTLKLLAQQMVALEVVPSISMECIRTTLKKRAEALAEQALGDSAQGQCRVRLRHGGRAGRLYPAL